MADDNRSDGDGNTSRSRLYRCEGIVIRRRDFGEADRLLTLLTDRFGKLRVLAKGTRRTKSRLGGHLEPFSRTSLLIARGRNLDIVTQAQIVESMPKLRGNEVSIAYAAHWAELVDVLMVDQQENRQGYVALVRALTSVEHGRNPELTSRIFELEMLSAAGFMPDWFSCTDCGATIVPGGNGFSVVTGGVLCPVCHGRDPHSRSISDAALRVQRTIARGDGERLYDHEINSEVSAEVEDIMLSYLRNVLERDLTAFRILKRLDFGRSPPD